MRRTLGVVLEELERMGRLAEDVTTLAGLRGRSFIRRRRVPLADFVAGVAAKAEPLLNGRLQVESVRQHVWLKADPDRLTQALLNLLQNVAVHTPDGTPVDFRVARERRAWRFEVSDQGPGLPSGMERTAFQLFRSRKDAREEFGLGLAIVRGIARAHRGSVGVRNRPGKGVTFWIRIRA
jgi:signal transduction histidine kinase